MLRLRASDRRKMTKRNSWNSYSNWMVVTTIITTSFIVSLLTKSQLNFVESVVVDGKMKGPSAMDNQSKEAEMIDGFNTRGCGLSDPDIYEMGFVNNAKHGQFPWLVSFQVVDVKGNGVHFCCGAFISAKWILSAAHCFADDMFKKNYYADGLFKIVAGTPDAYSRTNENFKSRRIYYHSRFQPKRPIGFDIALVELETPAKLQDVRPKEPNDGSSKPPGEHIPFINAICLPLKGKEYKQDERVRIVGWGASEYNNTQSASSSLLHTDLRLVNATECAATYSRNKKLTTVMEHYQKYNDLLCASFSDKRDACQGLYKSNFADSDKKLFLSLFHKAPFVDVRTMQIIKSDAHNEHNEYSYNQLCNIGPCLSSSSLLDLHLDKTNFINERKITTSSTIIVELKQWISILMSFVLFHLIVK